MNAEQIPQLSDIPDFGNELLAGFDVNAAFQEAIHGIAQDTELALEERVRRMENVVSQGASELYRDFIDFRAIAAQMETLCSHDHAMSQSLLGSEMLSSFMAAYKADDGHDHDDLHGHNHAHDDDEDDIDPKSGKKTKKKRSSWLSAFVKPPAIRERSDS